MLGVIDDHSTTVGFASSRASKRDMKFHVRRYWTMESRFKWPALTVVVLLLLTNRIASGAEVEPTVELRGLFMATVTNIDWPQSSSDDGATQRRDLINYLDLMNRTNMNALIFQVRPAGDAFYDSGIEPWSKYLTGTQGKPPDPYWDPLDFVIEYAHQRKIEVHAWLNPYRANLSPNWDGLASNHIAKKYPQYAYPYRTYLWMDPAASVVADHLISVITDILTRYSVDGILFDDYFYPYPDGTPFPDNATYEGYRNTSGQLSRDDWRRDNVNRLIVRVKDTIAAVRPSAKFGISPFGLYRPGQPEGMPSPITGLDPYSAIYSDSKLWLQNGWLDYLAPQLYWTINSTGQSYPALLDWWLSQNTAGKYIYAANGVYRIVDGSGSGWPVSEIVDQINISRNPVRRSQNSMGNILFSAKYFRDNTKNITDIFQSTVYTHSANYPFFQSTVYTNRTTYSSFQSTVYTNPTTYSSGSLPLSTFIRSMTPFITMLSLFFQFAVSVRHHPFQ